MKLKSIQNIKNVSNSNLINIDKHHLAYLKNFNFALCNLFYGDTEDFSNLLDPVALTKAL